MTNILENLETRITQEIHSMLKNNTNMWLIVDLDNEDCDSTTLVSADKIEHELTEILWDGFDNNFKVVKYNLDKLLEIKSQYKDVNILNDGIYMMNCNDITSYISRDEFYDADCDSEPFMNVINHVYDKLINNVNMYVKVLQEYMTDSRKCDDVERLLNLMQSLQTVRKIRE